MEEDSGNEVLQPDFQLLEESLSQLQAPAGAAESHGILCGMMCAKPELSLGGFLGEVLPGEDVGQRGMDILRAVFSETGRQLDSPDCDFCMLLPGDNDSLTVRSSALVSWCDGFLYGLGVTAGQAGLEEDKDGREFLSDLSAITRLAVNTAGGEDNEVAYAEIIEYVRTGVMVRHEMALSSSGSPRSGKPESS